MDRGKKMVNLVLNNALAQKKIEMKEAWVKKKQDENQNKSTDNIDDPDFIIPAEQETPDCNYSSKDKSSQLQNSADKENIHPEAESTVNEIGLTKKGHKRRRRKYSTSLCERKNKKKAKLIEAHQIKESCPPTCKMTCITKIPEERRQELNKQYWKLSAKDQRWFIFKNTSRLTKKRATVSGQKSRRNFSFKYFFPNETINEARANVKKKSNDKVIRNVVAKSDFHPPEDKRGKHEPVNKIDREVVKAHVESFRPHISHYRREHAPNKRYLPGDVNHTIMYNDFREKNPDFKLSYETYGNIVREMNISFTTLGHEECWLCDKSKKHKQTNEHEENNQESDCNLCKEWKTHNLKYVAAREQYRADVEKKNGIYFSADLQKVKSTY